MSDQLTPEEREQAARCEAWLVWYEDQFDAGPSRDPAFVQAVYADEASARRDQRVLRRPLEPGWDGYTVDQCNLLRAVDLGLVAAADARRLLAAKATATGSRFQRDQFS